MPRTRSLAWSELKIGVLTIAAIVIAAITIFSLTGGKGFFWQRYSLKTRFGNVAGLKPGSPVRVAGVEVGSVQSVDLVGEHVDVSFDVNKNMRSRITDQSQARLGSVSLLGESAVDITPSVKGTPIPDFGYVPSGRAPAQIADITDQASQGIGELTDLIHDVAAGEGHGREAADRRRALRAAAALRGGGRRHHRQPQTGERHGRPAAEGPEGRQGARSQPEQHRGHDRARSTKDRAASAGC